MPVDVEDRIPERFDLDDYIGKVSFGLLRDQASLVLLFRMKSKWASHLTETPLGEDQKEKYLEND